MSIDLVLGETGRDWGRSTSGSILLPARQQRAVFAKVDDVRYDLRRASSHLQSGTLVLSASLGLLALASVYRTASGK